MGEVPIHHYGRCTKVHLIHSLAKASGPGKGALQSDFSVWGTRSYITNRETQQAQREIGLNRWVGIIRCAGP